jgi:predicted nucleotidyltransferase
MSVCGIRDAEQAAATIALAPDFSIRVVSLPALVALKLFAWNDRQHIGGGASDLRDADFVLRNCCEMPLYRELSWDAYARLCESVEFADRVTELDFAEHAGAAVFGHELARILRVQTKQCLLPILAPLASDPYGVELAQLIEPILVSDDGLLRRRLVMTRYTILAHFLG